MIKDSITISKPKKVTKEKKSERIPKKNEYFNAAVVLLNLSKDVEIFDEIFSLPPLLLLSLLLLLQFIGKMWKCHFLANK